MDPTQQVYTQKLFQDVTNTLAFFTTPEFLVLCLIIAILVAGFRKVIEFISGILSDKNSRYKDFVNDKYFSRFYTEMFIPAMPLMIGWLFARQVTSYPYPEDFKMMGGRLSYGIIAGLLSAYVYPRVMFLYRQLQKVPTQPADVPVPPITPVLPIPTEPVMPVLNPQPAINPQPVQPTVQVVVNNIDPPTDEVKPTNKA